VTRRIAFAESKELRDFPRGRSRHNQHLPATRHRNRFLRNARIAFRILQTKTIKGTIRISVERARELTEPRGGRPAQVSRAFAGPSSARQPTADVSSVVAFRDRLSGLVANLFDVISALGNYQ
jgi:hypothetical protein